MAAVMRHFADEAAAMRAVEDLIAAGVSRADIQILRVPAARTVAEQREGTFDDENALTQREGTFDDEDARAQREGSFDDTTGHVHDVRKEPHGSFATTEGLDHGPRATDMHDRSALTEALLGAGIDRASVERLNATGSGGVVVVVESAMLGEKGVQDILGS